MQAAFGIVREERLQVIFGSSSSGFTPVEYRQTPSDRAAYLHNVEKEAYQRQSLWGFTTAQLRSNASFLITDRPLPTPDLQGIHRMFARNRFITTASISNPSYPLPNGYTGYWTAENDLVWQILQPVLRIATQFIKHSANSHWWQAFVSHDAEVDIPQPPAPQGYPNLKRFKRLASGADHGQANDEVNARFDELASRITWTFQSGFTDECGYPSLQLHGQTILDIDNKDEKNPRIHLAYEDYAPLLKNSPPNWEQRLMVEVDCATTLMHELVHAMYSMITNDSQSAEPYFENEPCAEVGSSMENAFFGGVFTSLNRERQNWRDAIELEPLAMALTSWPSTATSASIDNPHLTTRTDIKTDYFYPVQVGYFAELAQKDFWQYAVRKYGYHILHPRVLQPARTLASSFAIEYVGLHIAPLSTIEADDISAGSQAHFRERLRRSAIIADLLGREDTAYNDLAQSNEKKFGSAPELDLDYMNLMSQDYWFSKRDFSSPSGLQLEREILQFIIDEQDALFIKTMTNWTPLNSFRNYISLRRWELGYASDLKEEPLRDVLCWCRLNSIFFDFSFKGAGVVRRYKKGWDRYVQPVSKSPGPALSQELRLFSKRVCAALDDCGPVFLWPWHTDMRDCDTSRIIDVLTEQGREVDETYFEAFRRKDIETVLSYLMGHSKGRIVHGPFGVARRVDEGWPVGLFRPGREAPEDLPITSDDVFIPDSEDEEDKDRDEGEDVDEHAGEDVFVPDSEDGNTDEDDYDYKDEDEGKEEGGEGYEEDIDMMEDHANKVNDLIEIS